MPSGSPRARRPRLSAGLRARIPAPDLGYNVDDAPNAVPEEKAILLQNFLTGEKGRVRQRGPLTVAAQAAGVTDARVVGALIGRDRALLGFRDAKQGTRVIEPWVAPRADSAAAALAVAKTGVTSMKSLSLVGTSSSTDVSNNGNRQLTPSWAWTRMGNFVYAIAYDSDNDTDVSSGGSIGVNDRGGSQRLTRLLRFDIRNPTTLPTQYTYGPYGMQDIRLHYNRLFILGGRNPNTVGPYVENNVVWYTRTLSANHHNYGFSPNNIFSANVPDDSDNINGGANPEWGTGSDVQHRSLVYGEAATPLVYNQIFLPWEEDYGVCFASIGRNLGIFKRHYLLILQGFDATTFELRTALTGVGCIDPRSLVEANEGAYFLSSHGFMFFDGVRAHDASGGVKRALLAAGLEAVGDDGTYSQNGGFAIAELLDRDYIMLTIGYAPFNGTTVPTPTVTFCGIYHIPSNSWSTFTTSALATTGGGPTWLLRTENKYALLDHANARQATRISTPEQATEAQRGLDDGAVIVTKWHSHVVELAAPFENAKFHRVIIDYEWIKDGAVVADTDPGTGPTVTMCDGAGNALGGDATFTIPYGKDSGNEVLRQRHVQDCFGETSEVMVKIEYSGAAVALVQCAIHDVWIEWEATMERHTLT